MNPDTDFEDLDGGDDGGDESILEDLSQGEKPDEKEIEVRMSDAADGADTADTGAEKREEDDSGTRKPATGHLARERRLKREARQRADQAEAEVQRLTAENQALQARQTQPDPDKGDEDLDREIEFKTAAFKAVRAEFDPAKGDEEARLMREIAALEARKVMRKAEAKAIKERPVERQAQPAPAPARHPNVEAWLSKNEWFEDPDYEREARRVRAIDAQVYADGYRVEDADYFDEIERRAVAAGIKIPGRKAAAPTGEKPGRQNGSPVAPGRVESPTGRNSVVLSRDDIIMLKQMRLDPENKQHLQEFARNKLREERKAL